jgi:hypothetical protein
MQGRGRRKQSDTLELVIRIQKAVLLGVEAEEYRRLSLAMFKILEEYAPVIVPMSIDEGFLDLSTMSQHVWRDTTPLNYMKGIGERIRKEVGLPVSGGLANSAKLAKLSTDVAKPGFMEVPQSQEKEFLKDRPVRELSGIGKNRQRSLGIAVDTREGVLLDSVMGNSQTQKPEQVAARCLLQAITKLKCRPKEILMSRTSLAFALEPITRPLEIKTSHVAKLKELDVIYRRLQRSVDLDRC